MKKLYTPQEIADLLKVDLRTVYRWIREGKLAALKAGSQWRIEESALEGFLSQKG
jgi:acetyl-CoA synthetase